MNLKNMSGFLHFFTDSLHVGSHLAKVFLISWWFAVETSASFPVATLPDGLLLVSLQIVTAWTSLEFAETHLTPSQTSSLFWRCQNLAERLLPICTTWNDPSCFGFKFQIIWFLYSESFSNAVQHNKICFGLWNNKSPRNLHVFLRVGISPCFALCRRMANVTWHLNTHTNRPFKILSPQKRKKSTMIWTLDAHWVHNWGSNCAPFPPSHSLVFPGSDSRYGGHLQYLGCVGTGTPWKNMQGFP